MLSADEPGRPARSAFDRPPTNAMNRRVIRQILIALAIFAGIVLAFVALAQLG